MSETIYLDTCALNRLTDDLSQPRIRSEATAIEQILALVAEKKIRWITSTVVRFELSRNIDEERREQNLPLLQFAHVELAPPPMAHRLADTLRQAGFDGLDALHLGFCEAEGVDILLTVDDRLIRRAARLRPGSRPEVINPVNWLARRVI